MEEVDFVFILMGYCIFFGSAKRCPILKWKYPIKE